MARRSMWMSVGLAPFIAASVIVACGQAPDYPAALHGVSQGGNGGGTPTGGGSGEGAPGSSPCVTSGGQCLLAGNEVEGGGISCPVPVELSCGPGSTTEAGVAVLVCCTGFNDAGAPDVVVDVPNDVPRQ